MFTTLRRGVILQTPNAQIACGFGPSSLELWRGFLTVARIEYNRRLSWVSILLSALLGVVLGGFAGYCIGRAAASFTNNADWPFVIAFLGAFDGIGIALLFSTATSEGLLAAQKRLHPLTIGLGFLAVAVQIVLHQGALATLIVSCGNFIVGICTGLLCRQRIQRIQIDRELRRPVGAAK